MEESTPVQHGFRFEAMWLRAPDYKEFLEKSWEEGRLGAASLQSTWSNLSRAASSLKDWSWITFGSVRKKIRQLEGKLRDIRERELTMQNAVEEKEAERELCELFEREEIMARQRSRVDWLATPLSFMRGLLRDARQTKLACCCRRMALNVRPKGRLLLVDGARKLLMVPS
jgi:hypothetical protein